MIKFIFVLVLMCPTIALAADDTERTEQQKALIEKALREPDDFSAPELFENYPGGATTNQQIFNQDVFFSTSRQPKI